MVLKLQQFYKYSVFIWSCILFLLNHILCKIENLVQLFILLSRGLKLLSGNVLMQIASENLDPIEILYSNHGDLRNCLGINILWCHQAWSMYSLIMHVKVCFVIAGTPITCLENIQCSEMSWNFGNSLVLFCRYCIQGFFCSVIFSPFNTFKHFAPSYIHQIKIRLCFCKNCSVWYCPLTMGAKGVKWSGGIFSLHTLVGPTLLWKF